MLARARGRRTSFRTLLALPFFVLFAFLYLNHVPEQSEADGELYEVSTTESTVVAEPPSSRLAQFWEDLVLEMMTATPDADSIVPEGKPRNEDIDLNLDHEDGFRQTDIIHISNDDREALREAHDGFVATVKRLAPQMPYDESTRGIVMTAGGKYIGMAVTSLLMLRRTGSKLPVELWLGNSNDYNARICEEALPPLNARCLIMQDIFDTVPSMPELEHFQFKVFSIIFSRFREVLFLDADAWPIHNPDPLFDQEPYKDFGFVAWPDLWLPTVSPIFYDITGLESPALTGQHSFESGVMLYDKARHAESIILAAYYNFHGPDWYYPLLSQNAHGQGDKETFAHGAWVMGHPFYRIQTPMGFLGRWINGTYETAALKQADPGQDYKLFAKGSRKQRINDGVSYESASSRRGGNVARPFFIHHNMVKIDVRHIKNVLDLLLRRTSAGKLTRLWGNDRAFVEQSGYDVERAMWDEIMRANCQSSWSEECESLKVFYNSVFY